MRNCSLLKNFFSLAQTNILLFTSTLHITSLSSSSCLRRRESPVGEGCFHLLNPKSIFNKKARVKVYKYSCRTSWEWLKYRQTYLFICWKPRLMHISTNAFAHVWGNEEINETICNMPKMFYMQHKKCSSFHFLPLSLSSVRGRVCFILLTYRK